MLQRISLCSYNSSKRPRGSTVRVFSSDGSAVSQRGPSPAPNRVSYSYWKQETNRRLFFRDLHVKLGFQTMDSWYTVTRDQIFHHGGSSILVKYHKNSMSAALSEAFPEHPWEEWRFVITPRGFWRKVENQSRFLEALSVILGLSSMDEWYHVRPERLQQFPAEHGRLNSLLKNYYDGSLASALMACFPKHEWKVWKFSVLPRSISSSTNIPPEELREYLNNVSKTSLHVTQLDDWYRVSQQQLLAADIFRLTHRYGGLFNLLSAAYPEHAWSSTKFSLRNKKSEQRVLFQIVSTLFPGESIQEEFKTNADIVFARSKYRMDLDVFLPSLNIGFEYHGIQHYHDTYYFGQRYQRRRADREKLEECQRNGITVIELPYWIPLTEANVATCILARRPDLAAKLSSVTKQAHAEISELPPFSVLPEIKPKNIDGYGRFRSSRLVSIDHAPTRGDFLVAPTCMTGIRFQWYPATRTLVSRFGSVIKAPATFLDKLPNISFEGVLRLKGATNIFDTMEGLCNATVARWDQVEVVALDTIDSRNTTFTDRQNLLRSIGFETLSWRPYLGRDQLKELLELNTSVTLVPSQEPYRVGLPAQLLRISEQTMAFARIERVESNGAVLVVRKLGDDHTVKLVNSLDERRAIPGEVVEMTDSSSNPTLVALRPEKSWDEVLLAHSRAKAFQPN